MAPQSIRRINFLATLNSASSYLEVGVQKGNTFNQLDFPLKHAVDPAFRFDIGEYKNDGVSFFQVPSDTYFTTTDHIPTFDIIFLDGLHTYDQTYRDFCNSVAHSKESTIFIIDDTYPIDSFSAMRDNQFAVNSRRLESPTGGGAWHGDVFKMLYLLRLFHPKYQYATVCENNPQTIIWNKSFFKSTPSTTNALPFHQFTDLRFLRTVVERLSEVSYEWTMNECPDIFQKASEDELFAYLSACRS